MKTGNTSPSAAPPRDGSFDSALERYRRASARHAEAIQALSTAQTQHADEVNALDLPTLMQGPKPAITDRDPIQRVEAVLRLTTFGPSAAQTIAQRLAEVETYRDSVDGLGLRFDLVRLGEEAFGAMNRAEAAFEGLMATPAPTIADLAEKLDVAATAPWRAGDHLRLLAWDARQLAGTPENEEASHGA